MYFNLLQNNIRTPQKPLMPQSVPQRIEKLKRIKSLTSLYQKHSLKEYTPQTQTDSKQKRLKTFTSIETNDYQLMQDQKEEIDLMLKFRMEPKFQAKVKCFLKRFDTNQRKFFLQQQESYQEQQDPNPNTLHRLRKLQNKKSQKKIEKYSKLVNGDKKK